MAQSDYISPRLQDVRQLLGPVPGRPSVADVIRFASYSDGCGQFQLARESFLSLPAEIRAVRCSDCATCAILPQRGPCD
jgi:hypothetical protein